MKRDIMTRKERTITELQKASNHLFYEINMFQSLVSGMASGISGSSVINNALLESFAIHVRALVKFFYDENPHKDDVIAEDFYLKGMDWKSIRPEKTAILIQVENRANKEVAHLTYNRQTITSKQKIWEFIPIYEEMNEVITVFLNNVPKENLGDKWKESIKEQKAKIRINPVSNTMDS